MLFQTTDALISLARAAGRQLTVLTPFMDDQGTNFLVDLLDMAQPEGRQLLICRPLDQKITLRSVRQSLTDCLCIDRERVIGSQSE